MVVVKDRQIQLGLVHKILLVVVMVAALKPSDPVGTG